MREAVLAPGEADPLEFKKAYRYGASAREPLNDTAFRQAERLFKQKKKTVINSKEKLIGGHLSNDEIKQMYPSSEVSTTESSGVRVVTFRDKPGLIYIPAAISCDEQRTLLVKIFKDAMKPPSTSNIDTFYDVPPEGLFSCIHRNGDLKFTRKDTKTNHTDPKGDTEDPAPKKGHSDAGPSLHLSAEELLRKVRWHTLGVDYDWSTKEYRWTGPHCPFPSFLQAVSKEICALVGFDGYRPEAGIINYYQQGDSLTGHVDRSEEDDTSPLFSLSLGLDAVFLVGGSARTDPHIVSFRLSSGDVVIMSGPCRRCYHGVPLVIPDSLPDHLQLSQLEDANCRRSASGASFCSPSEVSQCIPTALRLIDGARINVNIRQVWKSHQ